MAVGSMSLRRILRHPLFAWRLQCRRRPLATSQYIISHESTTISIDLHTPIDQIEDKPAVSIARSCAHYFLDPLSWMRPELEEGKLEGRLECPKCHTNVGKYAWQGMQCSCSEWIVPAISLAKGRVDEVKKSTAEIRRPPASGAPPLSGSAQSKQNL